MSDKLEEYSAEWWTNELQVQEKDLDDKWRRSADKVVARYLDDRKDDQIYADRRKYNIFWANVQILMSALYATPPAPEVKRQHLDAKDDVARTAALMLERILKFSLQADNSEEHEAFRLATEDHLIPGLGQVWGRYDVETAPIEGGGEQIISEAAELEYVNWKDFSWGAARTWREVPWVAKRTWMPKKKFIARFDSQMYEDLRSQAMSLDRADNDLPIGFRKGRVEVFEIWCKDTEHVYWVHRGTKRMLDKREDPYKLEGFFPCPQPVLATHTSSSLIPRPDYAMCQDQYEELDTLNDRIFQLTKALRVVGMYDGGTAELTSLFSGQELRMIPVDNWAAFAEKGGMKGVVDWFPVEVIAQVLEQLMMQRQAVIQQIYELTSISDIMRGASSPRETAKAQTLKAQYSSVRLQLKQQAVAKFVCGALRIKAQIICNLFQPQSILAQSQIEQTESAQFAEQAIALLKNSKARDLRIRVGEETLSLADYNAEREMRSEFLMAIGQFLSQAAPLVQNMPGSLPYLMKMIQWVASAFRGADDIETVLDEAMQAAGQMGPPQEPPPPPDHSLEIAQVNAKATMDKAKMDNETKIIIAKGQADMEERRCQEQAGRDREGKQMEFDFKREERQLAQQEEDMGLEKATAPIMQGLEQLAQLNVDIAEQQGQQLQAVQQQLMELAKLARAKRKRTPTYDASGDITDVTDEIMEEPENGIIES